MSTISLIKNDALFNTCWFCRTHPNDERVAAPAVIHKMMCFLDTHTNQIIELVALYEPTLLPLALDVIHKARCGDEVVQSEALNALEALFCAKPAGMAAFKQLQRQADKDRAGQVRYRTLVMDVPRCPSCHKIHQRLKMASLLMTYPFTIGAGLSACGALAAIMRSRTVCLASPYLIVALLAGSIGVGCSIVVYYNQSILDALLICGTHREAYKNEFPAVQAKLKEGWQMGQPPATP